MYSSQDEGKNMFDMLMRIYTLVLLKVWRNTDTEDIKIVNWYIVINQV